MGGVHGSILVFRDHLSGDIHNIYFIDTNRKVYQKSAALESNVKIGDGKMEFIHNKEPTYSALHHTAF